MFTVKAFSTNIFTKIKPVFSIANFVRREQSIVDCIKPHCVKLRNYSTSISIFTNNIRVNPSLSSIQLLKKQLDDVEAEQHKIFQLHQIKVETLEKFIRDELIERASYKDHYKDHLNVDNIKENVNSNDFYIPVLFFGVIGTTLLFTFSDLWQSWFTDDPKVQIYSSKNQELREYIEKHVNHKINESSIENNKYAIKVSDETVHEYYKQSMLVSTIISGLFIVLYLTTKR